MSIYNLTGLDNSSGPLVMVQAINDNSGQWFAGMALIFLFLVLLVRFRSSGNQDAFLASSFIVSILAGLFFGIGVLGAYQLLIPVTMLVVAVIMKMWGDG